ncbi:MAG: L-2-hydroxyglutarate oxidase [Limnospira sp. PMC 1291.21]|uniref:L-2-hydroxyglutarate oxidase n=1 Tax=Limnospira TaxID=2596745 RepID=UPI001449D961|nr:MULTISPECIES: L-2-hydroxyglutarate oxidase [unclassified Limnospira]QJB24757.1 L-2-hydroxyglutarate oxidase [Limnospira fusiformis SAG 85.79]MDT9177276.1 L-2-hydroxyglutarate oxidase [Limnospira sp. PMC 1238.20]MDT9192458.1 L-2-hydroxyglutarate oxidase [Limnospira sp. PMC 1245.20]MDT9204358.1 L-2-hydroxyglutarate oxidase [Limnospira sp. PMC 1243.20]MDT9207992.1 L-2-hydroxyglutarate oxidase [Limnospira sp. PMC 1252.20]
MYNLAIIGGGIVGLSTAYSLSLTHPRAKIIILEKEKSWAFHQTGNNSGVIHSGIYYKPGSLKATLCSQGNLSMVNFCEQHGIKYDVCGKIIVATEPEELPLLDNLYQRGLDNQIPVAKITPEEVAEIEPHVRCLAAIKVGSTGIVSYSEVSAKYADLVAEKGGNLRLNTKVHKITETSQGLVLATNQGEFVTDFVINCAGLYSDRITELTQVKPPAKIIPFRGEYYELIPEKRYLVKNLIYPVPNPDFPFLGVHFTRMIDGSVHAGPNAVLSLKREGYKKTDVDLGELMEILTYPGLWKLAAKYWSDGVEEIIRSFSKAAFVRSLQRLIPEITGEDIIPTHAGVRAQALMPNGGLVDDFLIVEKPRALHVCNAPSPAATASLEIGKAIAQKVPNYS